MESIASFNLQKGNRGWFVKVKNLRGDGEISLFHFDTGASMSLVGLNTLCGDDPEDCAVLRDIIEKEIQTKGIEDYENPPKTITNEVIHVYPGKMSGVSISGTAPITFYFHIYLGMVNLPLLGFDYIDDCSLQHQIAGNMDIRAVASDVGKRFYPEKLLDFNFIMGRYQSLRPV